MTVFPDYEEFRSTLSRLDKNEDRELNVGKNIKKEDFDYGVEMNKKYCKNFREFHDIYMLTN